MKILKIDVLNVMTSKEMEVLTGVRHDNIRRTIDTLSTTTYNDDGGIKKQAVISHPQIEGGKKAANGVTEKVYLVNKRDSYVIIAQLSPEFTARLVDRWQELEAKESERQQAAISKAESRSYARLEFKPMTDAIVASREEQGKSVAPHHFSNEADLINRVALGMSASKFRQSNDIEAGEPIRDRMTQMQVKAVLALQRANTAYIEEGVGFEERKQRLQTLYDRRYKSAMIEETIYLNA